MSARRTLLAVAASAVLLTAACGGDDDTGATDSGSDVRTVEVGMVDIGFEPTTLSVAEGETVRFVFTNKGDIAHDAFIGDEAAQADHEDEMREAGGMEHGGHGDDADDAITVDPGDTGELTHTFDETGTVEVGCHQEGHYAAGMKITVEVA